MRRKSGVPLDRDKIAAKRAYFEGLRDGDIRPERWADVPRSLSGVMRWDRPDLGLYEIGHRNNFTTTHPLYGEDVLAIQECCDRLNEKYPLIKKVTLPEPGSKKRAEAERAIEKFKEVESNERALAAEFHRDRQLAELDRADLAQAKLKKSQLAEELREKDAEIIRLRTQLLRPV
jgi:hypothetical protein